MAVEDIRGFLPIDRHLGTAGQPTEEQLGDVAADGYDTVINLGLLDPRYCLADEAGRVRDLGMQYHHIPVPFDAPDVAHFRAFLEAMQGREQGRVFVHCAANYRVSSFMAVYGELRLGWSREKADAHARTLWPLNDAWTGFLAACRAEFLGG